ncbi:MAG: MarR family transcriptional regulator [Terracidiphilus sp.]
MTRVKRLDGMLCYSIYSAGLAIQRTYKPLLDELGITYPQYLLLNVLWEEDHLTIGDIGERLGIESSTLSPLVKRLQAAGLVERTRNPADERQVFVELTDQSKALEERAACMGVAVFGEAGISIERLFRLRDEVNTLRDALNAKLAAKGR